MKTSCHSCERGISIGLWHIANIYICIHIHIHKYIYIYTYIYIYIHIYVYIPPKEPYVLRLDNKMLFQQLTRLTVRQRSPIFHPKSPTFHPKTPISSKEPYIPSKEPYNPSKESCIP